IRSVKYGYDMAIPRHPHLTTLQHKMIVSIKCHACNSTFAYWDEDIAAYICMTCARASYIEIHHCSARKSKL
ncbi:MAG: hypothetical protein AAB840_01580, partial [Patescibacteria group bacterium]